MKSQSKPTCVVCFQFALAGTADLSQKWHLCIAVSVLGSCSVQSAERGLVTVSQMSDLHSEQALARPGKESFFIKIE